MYYEKLENVDDLMDVIEKDKICKLAVFDATNAEENAYEILKKYNGELLVCLSGHNWVDLMNIGVNKGEAIKIIQENYNISFDETMAFGDYLNDFEMMQNCKYSYAMENAHPKLKEICNYRDKSNDEDGVVDAIKKHNELKLKGKLLMEKYKEIDNSLIEEAIKIRRHLHQYPEISEKEYETSNYIKSYLDKIGIESKIIGETGVVATLINNLNYPTIALRAEIDVLLI